MNVKGIVIDAGHGGLVKIQKSKMTINKDNTNEWRYFVEYFFLIN